MQQLNGNGLRAWIGALKDLLLLLLVAAAALVSYGQWKGGQTLAVDDLHKLEARVATVEHIQIERTSTVNAVAPLSEAIRQLQITTASLLTEVRGMHDSIDQLRHESARRR